MVALSAFLMNHLPKQQQIQSVYGLSINLLLFKNTTRLKANSFGFYALNGDSVIIVNNRLFETYGIAITTNRLWF